jgi:hypothetical protein
MGRTIYDINEKQTVLYSFTVKDELGAPIDGGSLSSLTLTLRSIPSGTVVNNRSAQNVLNANDVTVDAFGLVTWAVTIADVTILDDTLDVETHRALFNFMWMSGGSMREFTKEMDLRIKNLGGIV